MENKIQMNRTKPFFLGILILSIASASILLAQVETQVPQVVPGAKPAIVEHIKVHGTALEGNLEGDAVDRDVIVCLPPATGMRRSAAMPWSMRFTVIRLERNSGRVRSTCPRQPKARSRWARRR